MRREEIENVINYATAKGIEYAELFFETKETFTMGFTKDKLEECGGSLIDGVGIRLYKDKITTYSSTSLVTEANLKQIIDQISSVYNLEKTSKQIKLKPLKVAPKKDDAVYLEDYSKVEI